MATSTYGLVDISGRFVLNQTTAGTQSGPAVAATGTGGFAVLYADSGFTSTINGSPTTSVGGLRLRPFSGGERRSPTRPSSQATMSLVTPAPA